MRAFARATCDEVTPSIFNAFGGEAEVEDVCLEFARRGRGEAGDCEGDVDDDDDVVVAAIGCFMLSWLTVTPILIRCGLRRGVRESSG